MTHKEILEKAIQKAIDGGWKGSLDTSDTGTWVVYGNSHELLDGSVPTEALYHPSHDFAKALWSDQMVGIRGVDFGFISMWAKQVAIEFEGRLHAVDSNKKHYEFVRFSDSELSRAAPSDLIEVEKVMVDVKDMVASVPFRTHRISGVDVSGGIPLWQYHLQQMVIADDPIAYLGENI